MPSAPCYRYHIFVCVNLREQGECCAAKGSADLRGSFKEEIEKRGLKGEVRANKAGCMDACSMGPSVVVYPDGVWYTVRTREDVTEIMDRHIGRGEIVERLLMGNNAEGDRRVGGGMGGVSGAPNGGEGSPKASPSGQRAGGVQSEPSPRPQALARIPGSPKIQPQRPSRFRPLLPSLGQSEPDARRNMEGGGPPSEPSPKGIRP